MNSTNTFNDVRGNRERRSTELRATFEPFLCRERPCEQVSSYEEIVSSLPRNERVMRSFASCHGGPWSPLCGRGQRLVAEQVVDARHQPVEVHRLLEIAVGA